MLGYLDPDFFLGGRMRLDVEAARRAIEERVARPLGLGARRRRPGASTGSSTRTWRRAARIHGIERGKDLRAYPLFAFGGAGPVHAWQVGPHPRVPRVLVPFGAGAVSAFGLLAAPLAFDFVRTAPAAARRRGLGGVNALFAEMEAKAARVLRECGRGRRRHHAFRRSAEMRYVGQGHEVEVDGAGGRARRRRASTPITAASRPPTARSTAARRSGVAIEALNWRAGRVRARPRSFVDRRALGAARRPVRAPATPSRSAGRRTSPEAGGYVDTPVYDRYALAPGTRFEGPAIVEERESTTVIGPGRARRVDARLTLIAEPAA